MSHESSRGNAPVTIVTLVPWEREWDITEVAMLAAPPAKRCSVSDSDVIVTSIAFILPLSLSVFACICILHDNWPVINWHEPIGLQKGWKGKSSHNAELSVMSHSRSQGTKVTIVDIYFRKNLDTRRYGPFCGFGCDWALSLKQPLERASKRTCKLYIFAVVVSNEVKLLRYCT